jgi:5-methyltetrahydrofolate--homocysteine methyltransferase
MSDYSKLNTAITKGDVKTAIAETQRMLDEGEDIQGILDQGLIAPMDIVGDRFSEGLLFVPHMLRSAKTMQSCMELLKPLFGEGELVSKGKIVIGTVKGDLHDIGKNLVSMMLEGAGFEISDLGVDVDPEAFSLKAQEVEADVVALSALLSTTMPSMKATVEALERAGIRDKVKIIIGGAPVTHGFAEKIAVDGYAPDGGAAVAEVKRMLRIE